MAAFGDLAPAERRRLARFGALLFIVGSATSVPAGLLLDPAPAFREHIVSVIGITLGVLFIFLPWERMSDNWLHAIPLIGGIEVIAGVAIFSNDYAFFYVLGAIYVAYVVRDSRVLIGYLAFYVLALLSPLLYPEESVREQAHHILVTLPVLVMAAVIVRYLRDTLEARESEYRVFASEAISLAERIRGGHPSEVGLTQEDLRKRLGELSEPQPANRS